jgi:hypothetical protein
MYTPEFQAYKQIVTETFLRKQEQEPHLDWLMNPTRVKIRQRCLELAELGLEPRDAAALRNYLSMKPGETDYFAAFEKRDAETFKTIENFLGNTDIKTAEKNIELLAWLIDYPHRPITAFKAMRQAGSSPDRAEMQASQIYSDPASSQASINDQSGKQQPLIEPDRKATSTQKVPVRLLSALTVLLAGGLLVWSSFNRDECMYWAGDRYAASPCSAPKADTPLVAMDRSRLKGFYRIKRTDTLTRYAVKRFWYARVADTIEVYSAGGRHPLSPEINLREVTDYIVNVCNNRK